jgi:hypothetical protein
LRVSSRTPAGSRRTISWQEVLDDFLVRYNQRCPHQGRGGMKGRTPAQAFVDGLSKSQQQKEEKRTEGKPSRQAA